MKGKGILVLLLAAALCGCAVLGLAWHRAEQRAEKIETACRYAVDNANTRFRSYLDTESEYDYHYAVAELTAFYDAIAVLSDGSEESHYMRISLNRLLGELMEYPELSDGQIQDLIDLTAMLKADVRDRNAYLRMDAVYNSLTR